MSASLVGSEMCIRDSPWAAATSPGLSPVTEGTPGCAPGRASSAETRRPVSYTHLTLPTICSV
eukprot:14911666-Alexandrium_andersonii.AAC.1